MVKAISKSLAILGMATALVSAQTMEETISKLGAAAGKAYVAPIVSGFGSNLNAGWYHKAPAPKKFGFHIEAGVIAMGTILSGGDKNFSVAGAFRLDSAKAQGVVDGMPGNTPQSIKDSVYVAILREDQTVQFTGETVIGPGDEGMQIEFLATNITVGRAGNTDTTIAVPAYTDSIPEVVGVLGDFADIPLPLFAPQITIGTVYGTNLTLRWLPEIETNEDIGTIKFFGFGIQHNPGVWLGSQLPVDLSVGFFTQTLEVGTLFKASSSALGLNVSKTFGWRFLNVTPYGGMQFEKSSFDFAYDLDVDGTAVPIDFTVEGENKYRATAGVSLRLLAININGDFNYAKYPSYSMGVMIGI
jgi:hypothetical protein